MLEKSNLNLDTQKLPKDVLSLSLVGSLIGTIIGAAIGIALLSLV